MAPLAIILMTKAEMVTELVLHRHVAKYDDPIFDLECFNPTSMKVASIWQFEAWTYMPYFVTLV